MYKKLDILNATTRSEPPSYPLHLTHGPVERVCTGAKCCVCPPIPGLRLADDRVVHGLERVGPLVECVVPLLLETLPAWSFSIEHE